MKFCRILVLLSCLSGCTFSHMKVPEKEVTCVSFLGGSCTIDDDDMDSRSNQIPEYVANMFSDLFQAVIGFTKIFVPSGV